YGKFINAVIRFLIQAAAIFLVIKVMNRLMREKEEEVVEDKEPELSTEEKLLTEIRDALKSNNS
ncbi:MAG: MscL family protein, partial [Planctomycetota bacterium]